MAMSSASRSGQRLMRGSTACQRCRRRKQKCDLKYPTCSNCENVQAPCLVYDVGKQAEIPRNYIAILEGQIGRLNQENQQLRSQSRAGTETAHLEELESEEPVPTLESPTLTDRLSSSDRDSSNVQDLVRSVRNAIVEPSKQPRFLGQSSGITLARMVMASIRTENLPVTPARSNASPALRKDRSSAQASASAAAAAAAAAEATLPPRHAVDHLIDVYFQYRTPHLPIVERSQALEAIDKAYSSPEDQQSSDRSNEYEIFITYMIFAIALCNVPSPTGGTNRPLQSEGCFRSAIYRIEKVITYSKSDLHTLRAVLLLAQFVSMCPWQGSLWHLTGIALRLCVDLGLHWETEEEAVGKDPVLLYKHRQLWHSAYQLDRVLGITLGRPFGIMDESVRVPLPNPWAIQKSRSGYRSNDFDIHHQRAHNHLYNLTKLESEIRHVQNSQTWSVKLAYPRPNYSLWMQDIEPRLQEWFGTIPDLIKAHPSSIFSCQAYWDVMYNNAILLLHRPNHAAQSAESEALFICYDASCKVIESIKFLQRKGCLDVLWRSVHQLFMAGLTIVYCIWQSPAIRSNHPVSKHIAVLQSCSATLAAMSENFAGGIGCRDVFERLSSSTVDWLVTNDAEETNRNRIMFEKQVDEFLGSLQSNGNGNGKHDMSAMLSSENFVIGEMLNLAAQWPDELDSNNVGFDPLPATGVNLENYMSAFM